MGSRRPPSRARGGKGGAVPAGALERSAPACRRFVPGFALSDFLVARERTRDRALMHNRKTTPRVRHAPFAQKARVR